MGGSAIHVQRFQTRRRAIARENRSDVGSNVPIGCPIARGAVVDGPVRSSGGAVTVEGTMATVPIDSMFLEESARTRLVVAIEVLGRVAGEALGSVAFQVPDD